VLYWNKELLPRPGLDPNTPPKTWPELGEMAKKAVAAGAKCGFTPQWQTWTMIENFGAWHNLPYATKENGFAGTDETEVQRRAAGEADLDARRLGQGQDLRLRRPRGQVGRRCSTAANAHSASDPLRRQPRPTRPGPDKVGMAMMPYMPDVVSKPQNSIIGGATLWVLQGRPKSEYVGVAKFLNFLSSPPVQAKWHQETGYVPITTAPLRSPRRRLLQEVPRPRHSRPAAHPQSADRELQGPAHRQLRADPRRG
jgi:sn-glycerol 3-phosphate transport system substrate-binding protein